MEKVFTNQSVGGPISVYVEDGKVTRIRPLQVPENEFPSTWEIEAGDKKYTAPKAFRVAPYVLAEKNRLYADDRILYPMKRVDFDPKGERNLQNRGKSGYVRISWDEAAEIVAGEIQRVQSEYGEHAVTGVASSHHNWGVVGYKFGPFKRFMNMIHYTPINDNPDSWEGWMWGAAHMWGYYWRLGIPSQSGLLKDALQNTEMIVFWCNDPDSTRGTYAGQESAIWRLWLKEKNVKCVFIDPFKNFTDIFMDGTWFPVRPGTDSALALAIMYVWLRDGTYHKDFIENRTTGFEEFADYLRGKTDGIPKTPKWAEAETTIPARKIEALACEWMSKRTILSSGLRGGWGGACRAAYGTEWPRLMIALQSMRGFSEPGVSMWGVSGGAPVVEGLSFPGYGNPQMHMGNNKHAIYKPDNENPTKQFLARLSMPEAIMNGHDEWYGEGFCKQSLEQQFEHHSYPIEGEVKMFYRYGGSYIGTMTNTNRWVQMYRSGKLEFIVNQDCWFTTETRFADIILPACTNLERDDITEFSNGGNPGGYACVNRRVIIRQQKCVEPLGESKSDYEIFSLIADKMGRKEYYTDNGKTELDWVKIYFEDSSLHLENRISWEEFNEKGYYIVPYPKDYENNPLSFRWYAEGRPCDVFEPKNPKLDTDKAHELATPSGKIEFVAESLKTFKPNDPGRPPMPQYIPSWEGHHSEAYEKYPLQLISPHPRFSFHTHYDHASWLDEIKDYRIRKNGYAYWVARVNPKDATARNVMDGDLIEMYNDRGSVVCCAIVTYRVAPGVVHSYASCGKYDPVTPVPGAVDRGGCVNILTPDRYISEYAIGMAPNSCLIEFRKWED